MRRVVVYAGTRNVYRAMATAAKSLILNSPVDRVYFLIEDDTFPDELPDVIKCVNVSDQTIFSPDGKNYGARWTYMTMMRLALPELFPEEDLILWLDVDTIVLDDISELFETDLAGCYFGAVEEPMRSKRPFVYHNAGVLLVNNKALRDGKCQELIRLVNEHKMDFVDQDAINLSCQQHIKIISPIYNSSAWTEQPRGAKIIHFAADRQYMNQPLFIEYEKKDWRA